jgi:hypothetical protein
MPKRALQHGAAKATTSRLTKQNDTTNGPVEKKHKPTRPTPQTEPRRKIQFRHRNADAASDPSVTSSASNISDNTVSSDEMSGIEDTVVITRRGLQSIQDELATLRHINTLTFAKLQHRTHHDTVTPNNITTSTPFKYPQRHAHTNTPSTHIHHAETDLPIIS